MMTLLNIKMLSNCLNSDFFFTSLQRYEQTISVSVSLISVSMTHEFHLWEEWNWQTHG